LDDLFSLACSEAIACGWLVVTNPLPADALPLELYRDLVADVRANGCRTLVDLSTPRVELALEAEPDLVKLNDWELAEIVHESVSGAALRPAAEGLRGRGARVFFGGVGVTGCGAGSPRPGRPARASRSRC